MGGLLGGPKGMLAPLSNYWGGGAGTPPGPPSSYAYDDVTYQETKVIEYVVIRFL